MQLPLPTTDVSAGLCRRGAGSFTLYAEEDTRTLRNSNKGCITVMSRHKRRLFFRTQNPGTTQRMSAVRDDSRRRHQPGQLHVG